MKTVDVFHSLVWPRYKGAVFSSLYECSAFSDGVRFRFFQIAETNERRMSLGGVDLSYHRYPFRLLFKGSYGRISRLRLVYVLFREVWRSDADLVVLPCYDRIEYWAMLFAALLKRQKRAVFVDSTANDRPRVAWKGWLKRAFLTRVDGVFAYGRRASDYVIGLGANPIMVFGGCQAAALPHNYSPGIALQARINAAVAGHPLRFLYVGRLSPEKSLHTLLYAMEKLKKTSHDARLVIIGSGPLETDLLALTASLGLSGSVEFAGSKGIEELALEYSSATCLVLPSSSEPWGLVANEALSYGCPIIVSDRCGCVPELIVEGVSGLSFACGDVEDLAKKMVSATQVFSDPAATARRCLEVISEFTPQAAATRIFDGCMRIVEDKGAAPCQS